MAQLSEQKLKSYLVERLKSSEFNAELQQLLDGFFTEMMTTPVDTFFSFGRDMLTMEVDHDELLNLNRFFYMLFNAAEDQLLPYLKNIEAKPKDFLTTKNYDAIGDLISSPMKVPADILDKIIKQPAMQELFINVIHDAIISFNKKYNPLFGAMSAMGLDKQIKGFIQPFMDQAMEITKKFVQGSENQAAIKDFLLNIYHVLMDQPLSLYAKSTEESQLNTRKSQAYRLAGDLSGDEILLKKSKEEFSKLLDALEKQNKGVTIETLAKKYNLEIRAPRVRKPLTEMVTKYIQSPAALAFLTQEFNLLQKSLD